MRWLVFMGWVILLANEWEDYSNYFGEGVGFPEIGPLPIFLPFMAGLRSVMAPVGVLFSMLMHYNERIMRLQVHWKSNLPSS